MPARPLPPPLPGPAAAPAFMPAAALAVMLAAVLFAATPGCVSPLEPDTPRIRHLLGDTTLVPPAKHGRIPCVITNLVGMQHTGAWTCTFRDSTAEADTAAAAPAVWLRCSLASAPPYVMGQKCVAFFTMRVDSIPADGAAMDLFGDPATASGVRFYIGTAFDSTTLQIVDSVTADPSALAVSTLKMTHQPSKRQFTGRYSATLAAYRFDFDLTFLLRY